MNEQSTSNELDYDVLEARLSQAQVSLSTSELHGMITGLVCVPGDPGTAWISEITDDIDPEQMSNEEAAALLIGLYMQTQRQFSDGVFAFEPMLPPDAAPLAKRSTALGHWCTGFLFGINLAGQKDFETLPDDSREVVEDIAKFSSIRATPDQDEAEESAYMELVEYIRVGVMLVSEELLSRRVAQPTKPTVH